MNLIGSFLTKTEQVCDYIPVVSTVTNGAELVAKVAVKVFKPLVDWIYPSLKGTRLIRQIDKKSTFDHVKLLVPIYNIWAASQRDHQADDGEESGSQIDSGNEA